MQNPFFWINIGVFFALWIKVELASPSDEELKEMKRKWDECCKSNVCIRNSCFTTEWRASGWAAVRQRCQGRYPDWPFAVDIFHIQKQEDIELLSKLFQEVPQYSGGNSALPRTVWTSGTRCPKSEIHGQVLVTRWTSSTEAFPDWLEDKISVSPDIPKKDEFCKFLVIKPATKKSDVKYDFQDQTARHAAICEFLFPGEVKNNTDNETTFLVDSTIEAFTGKSHLSTTDPPIKSKTMNPAEVSEMSNEDERSLKTKFPIRLTTQAGQITKILPTTSSDNEIPTSSLKPKRFCQGKTIAGIVWPNTEAGVTANERCPEGMTGYAQWKCSSTTLQFTPAKPHIQDCKHVWIKELEEYVENGTVDSVEISQKLAEETKKEDLSHGDITALVDLSGNLLRLYITQRGEKLEDIQEHDKPSSYNFTTSMVSSMSNILRAEIKTAWEVLPEIHQTRAASKILKLVTSMGSHLSCIRKSHHKLQFTVAAENIGMQTFILNNSGTYDDDWITFPERMAYVETNSSISLPADVEYKHWFSPCKKYKTAVGVIYNHVGDFLKDENLPGLNVHVATKVISFSLTNDTESITLPEGKEVVVVLQHTSVQEIKYGSLKNPRCMFWNFSKQTYGQWDSSGCHLVNSNKTHTICSCNHLTNFAVLMDVNNNIKDDKILTMMTYVCCGISSLTLIITLICFITIRSLHGRRSIITGNLCFSLLITNVLIIFGLDQTQSKILCATIAGLLHFWILSAFCWMLVEGYHLYRMVILVFQRGSPLSIKFYYLFAYGSPLVIIGISASIRTDDYGGDTHCWLSFNNGLMWSFVGPACLIILVNIVIFILTLHSASSVRIKREQSTMQKIKSWTRGSMSVMCLLGLTWCLGLFYIEKKLHVFSYIFTLLNGLQGVFIFLFHIVLNDKIKSIRILRWNTKNQEHWRKFPPQTSSNPLHSKTSTRTSVNSNGCANCNDTASNARLPSDITFQNLNQVKGKRSNSVDTRLKTLNARNSHLNYKKSKAIHTVSENGIPRRPFQDSCKMRSQSLPEEHQNPFFKRNIPRRNNEVHPLCSRFSTARLNKS